MGPRVLINGIWYNNANFGNFRAAPSEDATLPQLGMGLVER